MMAKGGVWNLNVQVMGACYSMGTLGPFFLIANHIDDRCKAQRVECRAPININASADHCGGSNANCTICESTPTTLPS